MSAELAARLATLPGRPQARSGKGFQTCNYICKCVCVCVFVCVRAEIFDHFDGLKVRWPFTRFLTKMHKWHERHTCHMTHGHFHGSQINWILCIAPTLAVLAAKRVIAHSRMNSWLLSRMRTTAQLPEKVTSFRWLRELSGCATSWPNLDHIN